MFSVALPVPELADLSLVDPTFSNPSTPGFTRAQPVEDQLPGFLFSLQVCIFYRGRRIEVIDGRLVSRVSRCSPAFPNSVYFSKIAG